MNPRFLLPTAQDVRPVVPYEARPAAPPIAVADLLGIIRRRRTLIVGVAAAVIAVTFVLLLLWPTRYVASATVVLEGRRNSIADQSAVLSAVPTDPASLQNQIQIIASRDLAGLVVDELNLTRDAELAGGGQSFFSSLFSPETPAQTAARQRNLTIEKFLKNLGVDVIGLSTTIEVSFSSSDPEKAARIANAVANTYAAGQVSAKMDANERATGWLSKRVAQLSAQVSDAEVAVQRYKAEHNLSDAPDGTPLEDQQVMAISTQLVQARAELAQKEANADRVRSLLASGRGGDLSQVVASPTIVALRQQQAELASQAADQATRYGPRHPKIQQIRSQRRDIEAKINEEVRRIAGGMSNDVTAARTQVASLEASLQAAQKSASGLSRERVELKALMANAQSTRTMYESFVTRLRETQSQDQIQTPDARVISRASPPVAPASPRRTLILGASVPAGLLLGLLLALLAERLAPTAQPAQGQAPGARSRYGTEQHGVPVLAEFPDLVKLSASRKPAADYVIDDPSSGFARAIAALDRQIATTRWMAPKVLAVTSAEPGGSKTNIALALARAAAQRGQRVILLDGDVRWPSAAPMMRAKRPDEGIAEVVMGRAKLSQSIMHDPKSSVMVLSWAKRPARVRELLESRRMHQLMAFLRENCDLIVIDAPPVLAPESAVYTGFADAVLFVASSEARAQPAAVQALGALERMGAPTIGIALVS
jgi:uncharacterized protein involved in exopolysaccharide biosynthesis/Mrp family chromosome partitioning ATPase